MKKVEGFNIFDFGKQGTCKIKDGPFFDINRPEKRYGFIDTYEVICHKKKSNE